MPDINECNKELINLKNNIDRIKEDINYIIEELKNI
jgi:hypothetical protein